MRHRAEATRVYRLDNQKWTSCEIQPEPIFRYSDQPRHILDATIWVWGRSGRPNVLQKIELTDVADRTRYLRMLPVPRTSHFVILAPGRL
jgi:hypothetical protein